MKVLVCIPCLLTGGTEIQTLSLVEALVAAGHMPVVACYFEYAPVMVERYRKAGADVRLLSPDGTRPVGIKATIKHLYQGLKCAIRECRPDVAHIQYMAPGAIPVLILKLLGVKKIIATTHTGGDIYTKNGLRVIRLLNKTCLTAFQCITERAEQSFFGNSKLYSPELRLKRHNNHFTIYNNIPSHIAIRTTPRRSLNDDDMITVGVISRLEKIKGMDLVVPAFANAAANNPHLRLLVVGDGSQRKLMERQAADAGIADRVVFAGRQPQSALQDYYDRIDILLMPSRSEGFGLTAIEGMARGCVPIVSNVGGLPEVVTPDCGLLHKSEDIEDLADKILQLCHNPNDLKEYSLNSLQTAKSFSKEVDMEQIKQLYNKIKEI